MTAPNGWADRVEIEEAMAAYARLADLARPVEQAALFVEDCVVRYGAGQPILGRPALEARLRTAFARLAATHHHTCAAEITFEGPDVATALSSVVAWHRERDGHEWILRGRYEDRWVRTPDGWRLAERILTACGATGRDEASLLRPDRAELTPPAEPTARAGVRA